jgi:hypothetical protein
VRPIPAYKAGLYGLTETRQLSNSDATPAFIPVHRTGFSAYLNKFYQEIRDPITEALSKDWTFDKKSFNLESFSRGVAQPGSALGSGLIFRKSQVKRENSKGFLNSRGFPSFIFQRNTVNQVKNRGYLQVNLDHLLTKSGGSGALGS